MQNFKGTSSPIGADCQFVSRDKSLFPYRPMRHRLPDTRKKKKKMKKLKKKEKRTGRKKTRKNSRKANGTLIRVIANPVASGRSRLNGGHDISIRKQWKRFTAFFAGAYTRVPRGYARKTVIPEWAGGDDGDRGWEEGSRNGCKRIGSRNKRCSSVSWQNRPARSFLLAFYRADGPFPPFPWLFTLRWPVVVRKNSYAPFLFILIDIISGDMFMMFYIYIYIQGLWFVVMRMSHVTWPFEMCSVNYLLYEKIIFIWKLHEIKIYVAQMFFFSCEWKVFVSSIDMRLRKVDGCWRTNNVIVWNCSLNYLLFKKVLIYLLLNFIIYVRKALYFLFDSFACYKIYEIQVKIFFKQVIFSIYKLCYKE